MSATKQFEKYHMHPRAGRTLIVGSRVFSEKEDRRGRYPDVVGVDMEDGEGVDVVLDLEGDLPDSIGTFSHIECLSVLEHTRRPWLMAANLERLLQPDGTIYVAVPYVWRLHLYPEDNWRIAPGGVRAMFPGIDWQHISIVTDTELLGEDPKKILCQTIDGKPFFQRCETLAFGRKPA